MQTYPTGSETTDGRFVHTGNDEWWDTTGIDLVTGDVVEAHMLASGAGIMCFKPAEVVSVH